MRKKLYIKTHGCQMNEYDSARVADLLREEADYELVETPEEADLLLLNTCSIREKAAEKMFSELGRLRRVKRDNPGAVLGVCGCVAQQEGERIFERAQRNPISGRRESGMAKAREAPRTCHGGER